MKKLFLYISFVIFFGCNTKNSIIQQQRTNWDYKNWKQNFKDRTLCICLLKGYEDNEVVKSIYKIDKSFYNPIALSIFDEKIDTILQKEILIMKSDSLNSLDKLSESKAGKTVFEHCIKFYKSKTLDSIVNIESKKWKKIKNIDSIIAKKMPAF